ncbi:hypothetical protein [Kribbella swartbergensis]
MDDDGSAPVSAVRLGPGQFLLDVADVGHGLTFSVEGRTFRVVSTPLAANAGNYLVTVREIEGPDQGRQLTVQLRLGRSEPDGA